MRDKTAVGRFYRMKALFCLVLCMGMMLLFGCEAAPSSKMEVPAGRQEAAVVGSSETPRPSGRPIVLGFSQLGSESDWRNANTSSIVEAAKEAGIQLRLENAEQSQQKQFEAVRSFIKQQVDVIAIAPVVESGWDPILKEVKQAGIPLLILDRLVEVSDPSLYITFIGSDFYEEGTKAGKYLLDKTSTATGPVGIVELRGTEGSTPSIARGKGFRDSIKERDHLKVIKSEAADFTYQQGKEAMRSFLKEKGNEIRVLYSHNDDMALGAVEAIEEYGLRPGKDIIIISVDGTRKAFEKMMEGKINSVVECNPLLGPNLMQAVNELMQGRTLPKRIITPESIFTEVMAEKEAKNRKY